MSHPRKALTLAALTATICALLAGQTTAQAQVPSDPRGYSASPVRSSVGTRPLTSLPPADDQPVVGVVQSQSSTNCITVPAGAQNLTRPTLSPCAEGPSQSWTITHPLTWGSVSAQGLCLDAYHVNPAVAGPEGWVAQLYGCTGSAAQTWHVSGGVLTNSLSSYCLGEVSGAPALVSCTAAAPSLWNTPNGRLQQGAVKFVDDFSGVAGAAPDSTKWAEWSACTYNPSAAFGGIGCGIVEKQDGAGHLSVPATPTRGSALRSTVAFSYGVFSAWMRTPSQTGYWPAFWLLNSPMDGSSVAQVGEIDAMEGYTTWPNLFHATSHVYAPGLQVDDSDHLCGGASDLSAGFHKYSVRIEPGVDGRGRITYYLDNRQCGAAFTPASIPGRPWPFAPGTTARSWMILDLAVGGAGGAQVPATSSATLSVDRVEVRQL